MKTNSISIRLSDWEKQDLELRAERVNMSVSNYVRKALFFGQTRSSFKPEANLILGKMSTEINRFRHDGEDIHIDNLEGMMKKLWQIL